MTEISRLQTEVSRWGNQQFGQATPHSTISHLKKEVQELLDDPYDTMEYADCLMLLLHGARRAGISVEAIIDVAWHKLDINRHREWGEPDEDGVVEHVRKPDEGGKCPVAGCPGTLQIKDVSELCSCHINPPCSACVEAPLECSECGIEGLEQVNG